MTAPSRLPVAAPDIGELELRYVSEAVRSGWVSSIGPFVDRFAKEFATYVGVEHCVPLANGTDALLIALRALGVGPGDEVIIPGFTFAAVGAVCLHLGAVPVLVDIDEETWCMDPRAVERAVSGKTRAIIPVHSYGHPVDMDPILELARSKKIAVLEDCAEAHGARYKGRAVGTLGDAASYSFYGNKIITTGEGGAVVTGDETLAKKVRYLRDHALDKPGSYIHSEAGYNARLTNMQAALGCAQLERVGEFQAKRHDILAWYRQALAGSGFVLNPGLPWATPVMWMVCVMRPGWSAAQRDAAMDKLRAANIDSRPFFVPLHRLPPYQGHRRVSASGEAGLPKSEVVSVAGLNVPSSVSTSRAEVERVAAALRDCLA